MSLIRIDLKGQRKLRDRLNRLVTNIEREPQKELLTAGRVGQLYAIAQAPQRTGKLISNIRLNAGKNYVLLTQRIPGNPYPAFIDMGAVKPTWGTNTGDPRMIDKRKREQKLYYFIGTEANKGKTLLFLEKNFPKQVKNLAMKIMR